MNEKILNGRMGPYCRGHTLFTFFTSAGIRFPRWIQLGLHQCEHDMLAEFKGRRMFLVGIESPLQYFDSTFDKQG